MQDKDIFLIDSIDDVMGGILASSFETSHKQNYSVILIRPQQRDERDLFSIYWSKYKVLFGACMHLYQVGTKRLQHGFYWVNLFSLNTAMLAYWLVFKEFNNCKWIILGLLQNSVSWINIWLWTTWLMWTDFLSFYFNWIQFFTYRPLFLISMFIDSNTLFYHSNNVYLSPIV